jgi:hypothetical protein
VNRVVRKVKRLTDRVIRSLSDQDAYDLKKDFRETSAIGRDSPNPWIRRSAEVPGYLFRGEHEFILEQAASAPPGDFVEIGVWFGKSASLLSGAVVDRKRNEKVFCFDPFTNEGEERDRRNHVILHGLSNVFPSFVDNARRCDFYEQVIPIATLSTIALPAMSLRIAFAFIDGAHDEASVLSDFDVVKPKLLPGAIVLFHDAIGSVYPGVMRAVETILSRDPTIRRIDKTAGSIVAVRYGLAS